MIRSPRLQGAQALLAAAGLLHDEDDLPSWEEVMLDSLRRAVGGGQALDGLDDDPLPDEPFDWSRAPADIHDRPVEVLALVDACCADLLDTECRTACRASSPTSLRGIPSCSGGRVPPVTRRARSAGSSPRPTTRSAGGAGLSVREMMAHFGVSGSPGQRAATMLKAAEIEPHQLGGMDLGSPRYLVAGRRSALLAQRDRYAASR